MPQSLQSIFLKGYLYTNIYIYICVYNYTYSVYIVIFYRNYIVDAWTCLVCSESFKPSPKLFHFVHAWVRVVVFIPQQLALEFACLICLDTTFIDEFYNHGWCWSKCHCTPAASWCTFSVWQASFSLLPGSVGPPPVFEAIPLNNPSAPRSRPDFCLSGND